MQSTPNAAPGFRKKLYLHDPTPEELAADAAEEERQRKADAKAAKKVALPFVPASVANAAKKPSTLPLKRPDSFSPANLTTASDTLAARGTGTQIRNVEDEAPQAPSETKQRTEADFGAQMQAQIQAEREYGITYAYDNRPKPPRGGKGRNKKNRELEPAFTKQFDVTQYTPADAAELEDSAAAWMDYIRRHGRKRQKLGRPMAAPPVTASPPRSAIVRHTGFAPPPSLDISNGFSTPQNLVPMSTLPSTDAQRPRAITTVAGHIPASLNVLPHTETNVVLPHSKPDDGKSAEQKKAHAADLVAQIKARLAAKSQGQSPAGPTAIETPASTSAFPLPPPSPPPPPPPPPEDTIRQTDKGLADYSAPFQPSIQSRDHAPMLDNEDEVVPRPPGGREPASNFAERMLKKYGWEKGQGLGAQNDGITTAIVAKAEKRKKLADADGGGYATPKNMGKIVGGKKRKTDSDGQSVQSAASQLSEVIRLEGMLDGLDIDQEIEDNGLLQEIGDEMGSHGTIERLFIWREEMGGKNEVFVKYVNQLSALRALQACDGMEFADNKVTAAFWDVNKFEKGEYS